MRSSVIFNSPSSLGGRPRVSNGHFCDVAQSLAQVAKVSIAASHNRLPQWVTSGHAEHVAAATGSPQKADPLAAGRDFGLGPITDITRQ